jgi:hypothetical protein
LVHTNKIVPKNKIKGGKKDGYENISKIFLHPKEKNISAAYFLQQSDLQQ